MDILQSAASVVASGKRSHPRVKQESTSTTGGLPGGGATSKRSRSGEEEDEPSTSPSRERSDSTPPSNDNGDDDEYVPSVDGDDPEEEEEDAGAEVMPVLEGYSGRGQAHQRKQSGVKLHISEAASKSSTAGKQPGSSRHAPAASSSDTKAKSNQASTVSAQQRRASARSNVGKKPTHGKAYSSDSEFSGTNIPFTSASRPSRLILSINKNPLKILRVNVQRHFFSQQQQKQIEVSGHSGAIDEAVVTAPVRLMGTPQRENLYFVAKDVCLLIHTRRGNVAKSICQFEFDEKARMPVVCPRQNGSFSTHVLSVLTIKGVKHLLGSSRSALAPHVLRWLLAQVDHLCDGTEEPPSVVPQMSERAKETLGGRGPVHSAERENDHDDDYDKSHRSRKLLSHSHSSSTKVKQERSPPQQRREEEEDREWESKRQKRQQAASAQRHAEEELQDLQAAAVQSYQANQQAQQLMQQQQQQQQLQAPQPYLYPPYYAPYPSGFPGGLLPPSYPVAMTYPMPYSGYAAGTLGPPPPQQQLQQMQTWQPQQMAYGYPGYPQAYQMPPQQQQPPSALQPPQPQS